MSVKCQSKVSRSQSTVVRSQSKVSQQSPRSCRREPAGSTPHRRGGAIDTAQTYIPMSGLGPDLIVAFRLRAYAALTKIRRSGPGQLFVGTEACGHRPALFHRGGRLAAEGGASGVPTKVPPSDSTGEKS